MGSFSELASDEYLLHQVGDAKSVTIIGCPYCTNQSIAYAEDISVIGKSSLGGLLFKPYAFDIFSFSKARTGSLYFS